MPEHYSTTRMRLKKDEAEIIIDYRRIKDEATHEGLDPNSVSSGWIKGQHASLYFKNPDFNGVEFDKDKIDWDKILSPITHKEEHNPCVWHEARTGAFDRLIITDCHIGMTPNKDGYSLYGGKWDEKELNDRLDRLIGHAYGNCQADTLYLDDLGDLMDGWDGFTTRKKHSLPQNMDNQKAFDVALRFKFEMIDRLLGFYKNIVIHNVCQDNHSGAFGYVVNSAFKTLCELKYDNVIVSNQRKFIDHYKVGKNVFILCHGKDSDNLKFGFKVQLDGKGKDKIDEYIDKNYLMQKGINIEFSKGDSHQELFDRCSSDRYSYMNYPAFSPSSNWIQTNYKQGRSGFIMFNYYDTNQFEIKPHYFDWKK